MQALGAGRGRDNACQARKSHKSGGMQETTQTMALTRLQAALLLILFLALSWLAVVSLHPPRPLPADAGPQLFSAERAFVHVRAIAGQPRPTGSEANRIVRQYISTQLEALGLSVEAQPFTNRLNNPGGSRNQPDRAPAGTNSNSGAQRRGSGLPPRLGRTRSGGWR